MGDSILCAELAKQFFKNVKKTTLTPTDAIVKIAQMIHGNTNSCKDSDQRRLNRLTRRTHSLVEFLCIRCGLQASKSKPKLGNHETK